jgi:hypothetical protein
VPEELPIPEVVPAPVMRVTGGTGDKPGAGVIIDNRTDLPDESVREAVMVHWAEQAALQFGQPSSFQLYATNPEGSMLHRSPFRTPSNVIDEIRLARQVVETDDDIAATLGQCLSTAYGNGMQNQHEDERTVMLFNKICGPTATGGMNMDRVLKELHREYVIAGQVNTISMYTRTRYNFTPSGGGDSIQAQLATPLVGVIPAENIRVLTNDIFGNGELAYDPTDVALKEWLEEFFGATTSPARKNQMRGENPIMAAIFTGRVEVPWNDQDMFAAGKVLYTLNPRMVHRTTMPKGANAYPRPPLTANFALLEAKRLLNIMDYSLLQGGTNYIVVAKQGSDQLPGKQPEIDNLMDQVRSASRTGVLVGDHRLSIDIITPDLGELLNPAKRQLLGRKLSMALLRIPEQVTHDPGSAGAAQELTFIENTITSDRRDVKRHIEGNVYEEVVSRNPSSFSKGAPTLWFPKIILTGIKDFFANVVQARDRGDIPRKWAVEVLGFDYEAGVAQRKREKASGDDDVMTPASVPYSSPNGPGGPPGQPGRPPGSSPDNGRPGGVPGPGAPPQRALPPGLRSVGEDIRSQWSEDERRTMRYGELTVACLEAHPDHALGRVIDVEREAVASGHTIQRASVIVIPVNVEYEVGELRAFRLAEGLSLIVGQRRDDDALVARALSFREPHYTLQSAEDAALRYGFVTATVHAAPDRAEPPSAVSQVIAQVIDQPELVQTFASALATALGGLVPDITIQLPGEQAKRLVRGDNGEIVAVEPVAPPASD